MRRGAASLHDYAEEELGELFFSSIFFFFSFFFWGTQEAATIVRVRNARARRGGTVAVCLLHRDRSLSFFQWKKAADCEHVCLGRPVGVADPWTLFTARGATPWHPFLGGGARRTLTRTRWNRG